MGADSRMRGAEAAEVATDGTVVSATRPHRYGSAGAYWPGLLLIALLYGGSYLALRASHTLLWSGGEIRPTLSGGAGAWMPVVYWPLIRVELVVRERFFGEPGP